MHVARSKKSVVTHRRQIAEWLPPIALSFDDSDAGITRSPRKSAPRIILRSRCEYDIVGHAEFEKLGSRQNADDARGAATGNLEEHTARQAENAWEGIGRGRNVSRAGCDLEINRAIDVVYRKAGVLDGEPGGLRLERPKASILEPARKQPDTDNGKLIFESVQT